SPAAGRSAPADSVVRADPAPRPTAPSRSAPRRDVVPQEDACAVQGLQLLGEGGDADWSPVANRILFTRNDRGSFQLFSMNPDGTDVVPLTAAQPPGGPRVDRHKDNPI